MGLLCLLSKLTLVPYPGVESRNLEPMRLGLIIAAATVYLAVLGCVIFPSQSTGNTPPLLDAVRHAPLTGLPYKGIALQIQRVDWVDEYKKSIDEIAAVGADTVELVVD